MAYERKREALDACPVEEVLRIMGGKWKARILYLISLEPQTFAEIRKRLPGIKQQVLSEQLKSLVSEGILNRCRTERGKTGFSRYSLTPLGLSLIGVLDVVTAWGKERLREKGILWEPPQL